MRSIFSMGFGADPFTMGNPGDSIGPLHINLTREEIEARARQLLKLQPVQSGWVGTYPKIVKVNTSGEYIVYADNTAQYLDYHTGSVGPLIQL
jgi:hypothetical protein